MKSQEDMIRNFQCGCTDIKNRILLYLILRLITNIIDQPKSVGAYVYLPPE